MRTRTRYGGAARLLRRAVEGRIGTLNFLIMLGSLSTLLLLYISLHVHSESMWNRIDEGRKRRELLQDRKTQLIAERNELSRAERIVPLVERIGMVPGSADNVHRVACSAPGHDGEDGERGRALASASVAAGVHEPERR